MRLFVSFWCTANYSNQFTGYIYLNCMIHDHTLTTLIRVRKHLPRHNQNPDLKYHTHHPEPEYHVPVLTRRPLKEPQEGIHAQPVGRISLTCFDDGSEQLLGRANHAGSVKYEKNESLQDHNARVQAALKRKQHDNPNESLCRGADCDTVWYDPVESKIVRCVSRSKAGMIAPIIDVPRCS